jgi:hypothetical protein
MIYGPTNVEKWADLENDGDEDHIEERITWARRTATIRINNRLRGGPYAIPFEAPYPREVVEMSARLAGTLLYDSRGITDQGLDDEPIHQLAPHRKMVERWMLQIHSRRIRIDELDYTVDYPKVVDVDES